MPIIKPKDDHSMVDIKIKIGGQLNSTIKEYCELFGIKKIDDFFAQAAEFVLSKDKDWRAHQDKEQ
jgi:hypothetical protein